MSSDRQPFRLGDLIEIKHGFAFKGEFFCEERTPYQLVTPGNFAIGGGFQLGKGKYYCGPTPEDYILKRGDLIVTMTDLSKAADTLGYAAVIPETAGTTWLHNQRIGLVKVKPDALILPQYLHYLMRSQEYRHWIVSSASGSTVKHTSPGRICDYQCDLPPLSQQRDAAFILDAIESRIVLLRETNATLEAIAQALFKSWFVDFDPVRTKQECRVPECMDEGTAALFPDVFEKSSGEPIPKGWRQGALSECCAKVESGGTPKRTNPNYWNGDIDWLTSGEVRNAIVHGTKETITDLGIKESSAKIWPVGTTVVAMYGATAGEVCILAEEAAANQACCGLIPVAKGRAFLFFTTRRESKVLASKSSGSAQQNLNKGLVASHSVTIPPSEILAAFDAVAGPLLDGWIENDRRIATLGTLRDTLLPQLISGRLRLPEAEEQFNEVLTGT